MAKMMNILRQNCLVARSKGFPFHIILFLRVLYSLTEMVAGKFNFTNF